MSNLNLADRMLAQKTFAARQVKVESKLSKQLIDLAYADGADRAVKTKRPKQQRLYLDTSDSVGGYNPNESIDSMDSAGTASSVYSKKSSTKGKKGRARSGSLPEISSPGQRQNMTLQHVSSSSNNLHNIPEDPTQHLPPSLSALDVHALNTGVGSALVLELAVRSVTAKTSFRNMQATVKKDIKVSVCVHSLLLLLSSSLFFSSLPFLSSSHLLLPFLQVAGFGASTRDKTYSLADGAQMALQMQRVGTSRFVLVVSSGDSG
jgi:hypothetical protein